MAVNNTHGREFFSKPVVIMVDSAKQEDGRELEGKIKGLGFSNVELITCTSGRGEPALTIFHNRDTICGSRIPHFLNYASQYIFV